MYPYTKEGRAAASAGEACAGGQDENGSSTGGGVTNLSEVRAVPYDKTPHRLGEISETIFAPKNTALRGGTLYENGGDGKIWSRRFRRHVARRLYAVLFVEKISLDIRPTDAVLRYSTYVGL